MGVLLALWLVAAGAGQSGDTPTPGGEPSVRPVSLDVIALDSRGRVPEGLKPSDFEIVEDGVRQTVDDVRLITADGRLFAIFLDEYHVDASLTPRVRQAVRRFIEETLRPQDLIVVMRPLDSLLTIRMTRGTDDANRLVEEFSGRKGDYTPRNAYERDYFAGTEARIEQLRDQVATSALNALALHLGSLNREARKTLVVVSEGLPKAERRRGLEALPTFDSVIRAANRSNVSVYAVDPREPGAGAAEVPAGDALDAIVSATGGRSLASAAELGTAMRSINADSSAYYWLTFRSPQSTRGFHQVRIDLKRAGVTIRTRSGYWTTPPEDTVRAAASRTLTPIATGPPRRISPLIQPWFGASRGDNGKTRVTFVWEPSARVPGDRTRQASASRVVIKALGTNGTALFEGAVRPTGAFRTERPGEEAIRAVFDVPPGSLRLQMSIEDASEQPIDSDVRDITVRDLTARVAVGTPEVLRARTAKDFRSIEGDAAAVPVVARQFSRTENLIVRTPVYAPADAGLTVTARLLARSGQVMRTLDVGRGPGDRPASQVELPLASLAAGEYVLEISARSPAGEASERLQIRVTN
jgi:VWFA-related protein